ncbi:MAG: hypothetical protein ACXVKR_18620, partial [Flavisolibacter sp.]
NPVDFPIHLQKKGMPFHSEWHRYQAGEGRGGENASGLKTGAGNPSLYRNEARRVLAEAC